MIPQKSNYYETLDEYRRAEAMFHTEIMKVCRKYVTKLNLVSMLGILEITKSEVHELDKATKKNLDNEPPSDDNYQQVGENRYF